MVSKEKILQRLMDERKAITSGQDVSDKWIENRTERLLRSVTDEMTDDDIDSLVAISIEDMKEIQANINHKMKIEAQKRALEEKKEKKVEKKDEEKVEEKEKKIELPEDVKEAIAYFKMQKEEKTLTERRKAICSAAKGLNEKQKKAFEEYVNEMNPDQNAEPEQLAEMYVAKFTKIFAETIGNDTGTAGGGGDNKQKENPNAELYKKMGDEIRKRNV